MATITKEQAELLRKHGFKWHKQGSTDRVEPDGIKEIIPTDGGFACIYNDNPQVVIALSVVRLDEENPIEWPIDPARTWIYVNWDKIDDFWKPGKKPAHAVG